jgi:hypothetical protein
MAKAKLISKSNKKNLHPIHIYSSNQNTAMVNGKKPYPITDRELNFKPEVILGIIEKIKGL